MKTNFDNIDELLAFIISFEGLRLKAYKCPAGVWTIGAGRTKGVKEGMTITREEAIEFLKEDVSTVMNQILSVLEGDGSILTTNQFFALTSFVYNVGIGNFKKSTLLKMINSGHKDDLELIHKQFSRWVYANKKVLPGLVKRREAEFDLYSTPDPSESMTEGNIDDFYGCNLK